MKIFLDTASVESIRQFQSMGLVDGVTTNPSLLAKEDNNISNLLRDIVKFVKGDVSIEVVSNDIDGMIRDGRHLHTYGSNVVVKVPMTRAGLQACKKLSSEGIPVNVTLAFSPTQAMLAAKSGAKYVSLFIGRLDDVGQDGLELVRSTKAIFSNYSFGTQILVASVRNLIHVVDAAKMGADVATVPPAVFDKMLEHPLTDIGLAKFLSDWTSLKERNPYAAL